MVGFERGAMIARVIATLLILICAQNAFSANELTPLSEQDTAISVEVTSQSQILSLTSDDHHSDCKTPDENCHQCHLGHCTFLLTQITHLASPDWNTLLSDLLGASYWGTEPSGLDRPPRILSL